MKIKLKLVELSLVVSLCRDFSDWYKIFKQHNKQLFQAYLMRQELKTNYDQLRWCMNLQNMGTLFSKAAKKVEILPKLRNNQFRANEGKQP